MTWKSCDWCSVTDMLGSGDTSVSQVINLKKKRGSVCVCVGGGGVNSERKLIGKA